MAIAFTGRSVVVSPTSRRIQGTFANIQKITNWILLVLAYALVAVRLWFRLIHQRRALHVSDALILAACLSALGQAICFTIQDNYGALDQGAMYRPTVESMKVRMLTGAGPST